MARSSVSRQLRWAVPAVVAAGVAAAAAISTIPSAGASSPDLPPKTAAQLLVAVEHARATNLSGTIVETADLGLPQLPSGDVAGGDLSLQSLLTGSHTVRVWSGDASQQRFAILSSMAEQDVIHNGRDLWTFTSTTNQVSHTVLPGDKQHSEPPMPAITPQQAAQQALHAIDPSTHVAVIRTARVAGQAAYQLELIPQDARSLIGSVRIAIDAANSLPLQVQVFARGASSPAIQVGFTDISFGAPDPSVFQFSKPSGARLVPLTSVLGSGSSARAHAHASAANSHGDHESVLGKGWTTVVKISGSKELAGPSSGLLQDVSRPVPGGRLIHLSLLSILITNSGTVYAGPVSASAIERVAATGHGL